MTSLILTAILIAALPARNEINARQNPHATACPLPRSEAGQHEDSTISRPLDRVAAPTAREVDATDKSNCQCGTNCSCPPFVCKNGDCMKNYVVMFTAKWCRPCREMYPVIEQMRSAGYLVYVIDVDKYHQSRDQFKIESVPTIVVMDKAKEVTRFVGLTPIETIVATIKKLSEQTDKYNFLNFSP